MLFGHWFLLPIKLSFYFAQNNAAIALFLFAIIKVNERNAKMGINISIANESVLFTSERLHSPASMCSLQHNIYLYKSDDVSVIYR